LGRRPLADEMNETTGRIAAKQRPLRSTQDFDPLNIVQSADMGSQRAHVNLVHVDTNRGLVAIAEVVQLNTSDIELRQSTVLAKYDVRSLLEDVLRGGVPEGFNLGGRKRRHRDRDGLGTLL